MCIPNTVENFLKIYKENSIRDLEIIRISLIAKKIRKMEIKNMSISFFPAILAIYALMCNIVKSDITKSDIVMVSIIAALLIVIGDIWIILDNYVVDLKLGAIELLLKEKAGGF